jgi:hypothetical protein
VTKPISSAPQKPVLDEQSFQQLLAAASVIQEHRKNLQSAESERNFTLVLSQVIETGRLLQGQKPDLQNAATIIVEQAQKVTNASGVALGLLTKGQILYIAASGIAACDHKSRVSLKSCLSADCLVEKRTLKAVPAENLELSEKRRIGALIAAPVWYQGTVAGILELRFVAATASTEGADRAAELFAGLASIVMLSAKPLGIDSVFSVNPDPLEPRADQESVGVETPSGPSMVNHANPMLGSMKTWPGSPVPASGPETPGAKTNPALDSELGSQNRENILRPDSGDADFPGNSPSTTLAPIRTIPATETVAAKDLGRLRWSSARKARQWLDQLKNEPKPNFAWLSQIWEKQRATIYLAIAALILLVAIAQIGFSGGRGQPTASAPAKSHRHKVAALHLTLFEQLLVGLGLAEAPPVPTYQGNPNVQVWVDIHTALYYCPGADLYGKTNGGRFTTQIEAQQDQFEPANRQVCD